jgi:hypothetical protein
MDADSNKGTRAVSLRILVLLLWAENNRMF